MTSETLVCESKWAFAYGFESQYHDSVGAWMLREVAEGKVVGCWNGEVLTLHWRETDAVPSFSVVASESSFACGDEVPNIVNVWQALDYFLEGELDAFATDTWYIEITSDDRAALSDAEMQTSDDLTSIKAKMANRAYVLNQIAKVFAARGMTDAAIQLLGAAIEVMPVYAEPYSNFGVILWQVGKQREALSLFIEAMLKNAHHKVVQLNFFDAIYEMQEYEVGANLIESILPSFPDHIEFRHYLAVFYKHMGRKREAIHLLSDILGENPHDEEAKLLIEDIASSEPVDA